jgi:hypothetical protein
MFVLSSGQYLEEKGMSRLGKGEHTSDDKALFIVESCARAIHNSLYNTTSIASTDNKRFIKGRQRILPHLATSKHELPKQPAQIQGRIDAIRPVFNAQFKISVYLELLLRDISE